MAEMFWPGGESPVTPAPSAQFEDGLWTLSGEEGASLGYRVDEGPWRLYSEPFPAAGDAAIETRAVRYGWEASDIVQARQ